MRFHLRSVRSLFLASRKARNKPSRSRRLEVEQLEERLVPTLTLNPVPPSLASAVVNSPYSQTLTASGGSGKYTYIETGALPVGLGFSSSGLLAGTPETAGSYSFTIIAIDQSNPSLIGTQTYTLRTALGFDLAPLPTGTYNVPYSQDAYITPAGGSGSYSFAVSGSFPAGMSLDPNTGRLSGTPTQAGVYTFTVTATDTSAGQPSSGLSASHTFTLPVNLALSPSTPLKTATIGATYTKSFTASGGSGNYSYSEVGTLPSGLTFSSSSGNLSGTPTQAGTYNFIIQATDRNNPAVTGSQDYTLNAGLQLSPGTIQSATTGASYTEQLFASGGTGSYSFSTPSAATGTSTGSNAAVSTLNDTSQSWTPSQWQGDLLLITGGTGAGETNTILDNTTSTLYLAKDWPKNGVPDNTSTYIISSTSALGQSTANTSTTLTDTHATWAVNQWAPTGGPVYQVLITAGDKKEKGERNTIFSNTTGSLTLANAWTHTPGKKADYAIGPAGSLGTVTAASGSTLTDSKQTSWTLNEWKGDIVLITDGTGKGEVNSITGNATTGTLYLANTWTTVPDTTSTYVIIAPAAGSSSGTSSGSNTKAPSLNDTTQTWTANQWAGYMVVITGGTGKGETNVVVENTTQTLYLAHSWPKKGVPDSTSTYALALLAPGIELDPKTGTLSGTPTQGGTYSFPVTATDSNNSKLTVTQTYTLVVGQLQVTEPQGGLPPATVGSTYSQTFGALYGTSPYTFAIASWKSSSGETGSGDFDGLHLNSTSGNLSGKPTNAGEYSFTINLRDSNGYVGYLTDTLVVFDTPKRPPPSTGTLKLSSLTTTGNVGTAYGQTITATGGAAGDTYAFSETGALPTGMSFTSTGQLTGTPMQPGSYNFTVIATDNNNPGLTGREDYTLTINGLSGALTTFTTAVHTTLGDSAIGTKLSDKTAVDVEVASITDFSSAGGTVYMDVTDTKGKKAHAVVTYTGTKTSGGKYYLTGCKVAKKDDGDTLGGDHGKDRAVWSINQTLSNTTPIDLAVSSTGGFPTSGQLVIQTKSGSEVVSYTGTSSSGGDSFFTGVTGGTGSVSTNFLVSQYTPSTPLALSPTILPRGTVGDAYENASKPSYYIIPTGGDGSYTLSLTAIAGGTSTGSNTSGATLNDTSQSWTANQWQGDLLVITDGTGKGETNTVLQNTATQLSLANGWNKTPDGSSRYIISSTSTTGQATGDASNTTDNNPTGDTPGNITLTDSTQNWVQDQWAGDQVLITDGTDKGDINTIVSNTTGTLYLANTWAVPPDSTSEYAIGPAGSLGTVTAASGSTLTDSKQTSWTLNEWKGDFVLITGGTDKGDVKVITGNDTKGQLTLADAWGSTVPDHTSTYVIIAPDTSGTSSGKNTQAATLNDTTRTWTVNQWAGYEVQITGGTGKGEVNTVVSNTAGQLVLVHPWKTTPDSTSTYTLARLAPGIQLDPETGILSGRATTPGTYAFTVTVTDGSGASASQQYSITILPRSPVSPAPSGYTPQQIQQAYGINDIILSGGIKGDGAGQTIAIIAYGDDPNFVSSTDPNFLTSRLHTFDTYFGLPDPPSFLKLDQNGGTNYPSKVANTGETEQDVEWAHALAPGANIILFVAPASGPTDVLQTALRYPGVTVITRSYGSAEKADDPEYASDWLAPVGKNVTVVNAAGDNNDKRPPSGPPYPASIPYVLAAGMTELVTDSQGNYLGEAGNAQANWGASTYEGQPAYQKGIVTIPGFRNSPDVSFVGEDTSTANSWVAYSANGTSLASPSWAALISIANEGLALSNQAPLNGATDTLPDLYNLPDSDFNKLVNLDNGATSNGDNRYNQSGLGSPIANRLIPGLVGGDHTICGHVIAGQPQPGWTVFLSATPNAVWTPEEASTTTDANGYYSFLVAPGTYYVNVVPPAGWNLSGRSSGPISLAAGADTQEVANLVLTGPAPQTYVNNLYRLLLNRNPDASAAGWVNALTGGTLSPADVVLGIEQSPEYLNDLVAALYQHYLNRAPDSAAQGWVTALQNGATVEQVIDGLVGSPEFFNVEGGGANAGYLTALYQYVLGRNPDTAGYNAWLAALNGGTSPATVGLAFLNSTEYRQNLIAGVGWSASSPTANPYSSYFQGYYLTYLLRQGDPAGVAGWLTDLQNGVSDQQVLAGILGAAEGYTKWS